MCIYLIFVAVYLFHKPLNPDRYVANKIYESIYMQTIFIQLMHIKFVNARVPASTQLLNYIQTSLGQLDMYFNRVLPLETYDECYLPVYVLYDNNGKLLSRSNEGSK